MRKCAFLCCGKWINCLYEICGCVQKGIKISNIPLVSFLIQIYWEVKWCLTLSTRYFLRTFIIISFIEIFNSLIVSQKHIWYKLWSLKMYENYITNIFLQHMWPRLEIMLLPINLIYGMNIVYSLLGMFDFRIKIIAAISCHRVFFFLHYSFPFSMTTIL